MVPQKFPKLKKAEEGKREMEEESGGQERKEVQKAEKRNILLVGDRAA